MADIKLELTIDETNQVLAGLGELPSNRFHIPTSFDVLPRCKEEIQCRQRFHRFPL